MAYPIVEIELTRPLPDLDASERDDGIALVVRNAGRPLGFLMLAADARVGPVDLERRVAEQVSADVLERRIREELDPKLAEGEQPALTAAICTRDRPERLARCLDSLDRLERSGEGGRLRFDILVVDNAPSDERTREVVSRSTGVRYLREARPGLNFARNRALRDATGDFVAYLDDDVIVDRGWLEGFREAIAEHPDALAITGQVLPLELATTAQILFEQRGGFRHGFARRRYTRESSEAGDLYPCKTGIFGVGCNMAFRRREFLELGGFDEALDTGPPLPGGGDHDAFYRAVRSGGALVYEPRFLVFHEHRRSMAQLRYQYWTWGLSVMAFAAKAYRQDRPMRPTWRRLFYHWFRRQLADVARSLVGRHPLPPDCILRETFGGVVGLCGEYHRSLRRVEARRRQHP